MKQGGGSPKFTEVEFEVSRQYEDRQAGRTPGVNTSHRGGLAAEGTGLAVRSLLSSGPRTGSATCSAVLATHTQRLPEPEEVPTQMQANKAGRYTTAGCWAVVNQRTYALFNRGL